METCLVATKDYYNLAIDIYKTLTLERPHRTSPGKEYLDETYNKYVSITEKCIPNKRKITDQLFAPPSLPKNEDLRLSIANHPTPPSSVEDSSSDDFNIGV